MFYLGDTSISQVFLSLVVVSNRHFLLLLAANKVFEKADPLASGGQKGNKIWRERVFLPAELSALGWSRPTCEPNYKHTAHLQVCTSQKYTPKS